MNDSPNSVRTYNNIINIRDDDPGVSLKSVLYPVHYENDIDRVVIPHGLVQDRIERLASDIFDDFVSSSGDDGIHAICVLKGGYKFFTDLLDKIQIISSRNRSLRLTIHFIRARSYQDDKSTGNVDILGLYELGTLKGKSVLLVEDIVDTGVTIKKVAEYVQQYEPRCIKVASLLLKRTPLHNGFFPDYVGFSIPDLFVIGYALDFNEHFRDLRHICVISEEGKKKYASK